MVTICTTSLTFNNSTFCPHSVVMCPVINDWLIGFLYEVKKGPRTSWVSNLRPSICIVRPPNILVNCAYTINITESDTWMHHLLSAVHVRPANQRTVSGVAFDVKRTVAYVLCGNDVHPYVHVTFLLFLT